jgi:GAF domain-containing protein
VADTGEPLLVPDVSQEPRYYSLPEASEIRSELAVPLKTKEAVIGVLHVQSEHLNAFDESDLAVLQSLASQAAIAIENARLYEQAQQVVTLEERQRLARELHDSVTQALYGVTLYAEAAARLLSSGEMDMAADHLGELRDTAQEALRLVARGQSNQEIADQLVISEATVRTHVSNILGKLHLASRTQAALYALREGLASLAGVDES